jgi:drug/metabolite transporter (DMT)-like permease
MTHKTSYLPLIAILGCCLIWGTTFTVVKNVSENIDPFLLSTFRNSIAVLSMLLYFIVSKKINLLKDKKALISGSVLGVMLGAIYISQTIGITYTSANHSAFITCSAVVMVPIILLMLGWEKIKLRQFLSISLVGVGLTLLTLKNDLTGLNLGDFITFLAAIICALHIVYAGKYVRENQFLALIFYQFVIAALVSFLGLLVKQSTNGFQPILLNDNALFSVIYLGFLGTLFCYFVTVWGQKYVSTIYLALIFSLEPLLASVTNYFVLGETFTLKELAGSMVIFIGIIIYSVTQPKKSSVDSLN